MKVMTYRTDITKAFFVSRMSCSVTVEV